MVKPIQQFLMFIIDYPLFFESAILVLSMTMLCTILVWCSKILTKFFATSNEIVIARIEDLLPQTQCGQCDYAGCRPYAEAVAEGDAINKCVPGGQQVIDSLVSLLGCGASTPIVPINDADYIPVKAHISEAECIGCNKCVPPCPVDAIIGSPKNVYTVIDSECTGCGLCISACPVDCIALLPLAYEQQPEPAEIPVVNSNNACISCNFCAEVCPAQLYPQKLYAFANDMAWHKLYDQQLLNCIECGACSRVCPSEIPLDTIFKQSKKMVLATKQDKEIAKHAKERYEFRKVRLLSEREAREKKRAARMQTLTR